MILIFDSPWTIPLNKVSNSLHILTFVSHMFVCFAYCPLWSLVNLQKFKHVHQLWCWIFEIFPSHPKAIVPAPCLEHMYEYFIYHSACKLFCDKKCTVVRDLCNCVNNFCNLIVTNNFIVQVWLAMHLELERRVHNQVMMQRIQVK